MYPSKKSISVTYVFSTQRKSRKSSLPWAWETRVPGEGAFLSRGWRCRSWQCSEAVWTALAKEKRCEGARHVRVRGQAGETGSFRWECVIIQPFNFPLKWFLKYLTDRVSQQIFQSQLWHFELSALLFFFRRVDKGEVDDIIFILSSNTFTVCTNNTHLKGRYFMVLCLVWDRQVHGIGWNRLICNPQHPVVLLGVPSATVCLRST